MQHPDKCDVAQLWIRSRATLLVATTDARPLDATIAALRDWGRSPERKQLMQQYLAGGWNLERNAPGKRLTVSLLEAARRR